MASQAIYVLSYSGKAVVWLLGRPRNCWFTLMSLAVFLVTNCYQHCCYWLPHALCPEHTSTDCFYASLAFSARLKITRWRNCLPSKPIRLSWLHWLPPAAQQSITSVCGHRTESLCLVVSAWTYDVLPLQEKQKEDTLNFWFVMSWEFLSNILK